jgi:hypothetical protein
MVKINVSISLNLGPRLLRVGDKVLALCEGVSITVIEATAEELSELVKAPVIELVKPKPEEMP